MCKIIYSIYGLTKSRSTGDRLKLLTSCQIRVFSNYHVVNLATSTDGMERSCVEWISVTRKLYTDWETITSSRNNCDGHRTWCPAYWRAEWMQGQVSSGRRPGSSSDRQWWAFSPAAQDHLHPRDTQGWFLRKALLFLLLFFPFLFLLFPFFLFFFSVSSR